MGTDFSQKHGIRPSDTKEEVKKKNLAKPGHPKIRRSKTKISSHSRNKDEHERPLSQYMEKRQSELVERSKISFKMSKSKPKVAKKPRLPNTSIADLKTKIVTRKKRK